MDERELVREARDGICTAFWDAFVKHYGVLAKFYIRTKKS
jgi:hypothetical protein